MNTIMTVLKEDQMFKGLALIHTLHTDTSLPQLLEVPVVQQVLAIPLFLGDPKEKRSAVVPFQILFIP